MVLDLASLHTNESKYPSLKLYALAVALFMAFTVLIYFSRW